MDNIPIDILALAKGNKALALIIAQNLQAGTPGIGNILCSMLTHEYLSRFLTKDPLMEKVKNKTMRLSSLDMTDPVLIKGESGTGKELIAHALHGDRTGNFVGINCTSLPSELLESELFGHVKGAFTGAYCDKTGKFEYAMNGTLFLDEIGDMPVLMQAKLLRVLQERVITKLGDNKEIPINVRIVSATNRLDIGANGFRKDLFYRLATFELYLTPIRERPDDIELIIKSLDKDNKLPIDLREKLKNHPLPGNVRQLQSIVKRYQIFAEADL